MHLHLPRSRREFLAALASVLALPAAARALEPAGVELSASDRRIASIGRRIEREDAEAAAGLLREVEAQMPLRSAFVSPGRRARRAREHLLTPGRLAAELEAGDVVTADGWVLARSEGALATYLDSLLRERAVPA